MSRCASGVRTLRRRAALLSGCVLLAPITALAATAWEPLPGLSAGLCRAGSPFHAALAAADLPAFRTEGFKPGYGLLQAATEADREAASGGRLPLGEGFGNSTIRLSTANERTQRWFDQGLRLSWGFDHGDAIAAFRNAQMSDPGCAMCYWGEAFAWGPNINAPMPTEAVSPAFAAIAQAKYLAEGASELERGLIDALARRYSVNPGADRKMLDRAYADAMAKLAARYPDEDEVQVLFADALMNLQPWDYWQADKVTPKGRTAEQVAALERVLARNPDHAAAIHLYIHTVEASTTPERAEPYADRLAAQAPSAGHLVHMPAHIYFRIGRYLDSLEANKVAVGVDEALFAKAPSAGIYRYVYYPHNVHFVLVSAARAGDGQAALSAADKLGTILSDDLARQFGRVQAIKLAPYYARAEFMDPAKLLAEPKPDGGMPWVEGAWHFARGVAAVRSGDLGLARQEAAAVAAIDEANDFAEFEAQAVPTNAVLRIAQLVLDSRIARAEGRAEDAVASLQEAAVLQDGLAYMEPPYWYYPVRQSLGAALLEAGRPKEAVDVLTAALEEAPNNAYALAALRQAHETLGDAEAAKAAGTRFEAAWAGNAPPALDSI